MGAMNALGEYDWVANPRCESPTAAEQLLIERRADLTLVGYVSDAELSYEYDDYALVILDGALYLLNTSGCSCPDPCETRGVTLGPATLDEMRTHLSDARGEKGYGVTARQHAEFLALCDEAAELLGVGQ